MTETVVVAGATGYAGRHIVTALDAAGYRVRALVRSQRRAEAPGRCGAPSLAGRVTEWRTVDVADPVSVHDVCRGADHVISALGVTRQKTSPWNVDYLANLRLLHDARRLGAASFTYINVIGVERGTSTIMRAKHAFVTALEDSGVPAQIINPSAYFSDMTDVFGLARRGIDVTVNGGATRIMPLHGADLADFVADHLAEGPGTWTIGGPETFTYRELLDLCFAIAGRRRRLLTITDRTARWMQRVADLTSPRAADLVRFLVEGLHNDAVGEPIGAHRLEPFLRTLAGETVSTVDR